MKRTINLPPIEVSRHHDRSGSLSSIGSWGSFSLDSSAWLPDQPSYSHQHPILNEYHAEQQTLRRRRVGPEMLAILASSSPEIHALCKSVNFSSSSLDHHHRRGSSIGSNISAGSSSIGSPSLMVTKLSEEVAQRLDRPVASRVSLSPTMPLSRSPLADVTDDLGIAFASIHLYPNTTTVSNVDEESNKENVPPMISCHQMKESPKSRRPPKPTPTHRSRWSLHRRISFDSLPSPGEIGTAGPHLQRQQRMSASQHRGRPRHRRNTRHIFLPRSKSPSLCR
jgi:hypothetical protein